MALGVLKPQLDPALTRVESVMAAIEARIAGRHLAPGARLVIRTGLGDGSGRGRTTRITDRLAHTFGWMQEIPKQYPTRAGLATQLQAAGLAASFEPLYGNTPFNNWLVVAERGAA